MREYHQRLNSSGGTTLGYGDDELVLQRVLAESLLTSGSSTNLPQIQLPSLQPGVGAVSAAVDDTLSKVLELSKKEEEERKRREMEEEEELRKVLELSLLEK